MSHASRAARLLCCHPRAATTPPGCPCLSVQTRFLPENRAQELRRTPPPLSSGSAAACQASDTGRSARPCCLTAARPSPGWCTPPRHSPTSTAALPLELLGDSGKTTCIQRGAPRQPLSPSRYRPCRRVATPMDAVKGQLAPVRRLTITLLHSRAPAQCLRNINQPAAGASQRRRSGWAGSASLGHRQNAHGPLPRYGPLSTSATQPRPAHSKTLEGCRPGRPHMQHQVGALVRMFAEGDGCGRRSAGGGGEGEMARRAPCGARRSAEAAPRRERLCRLLLLTDSNGHSIRTAAVQNIMPLEARPTGGS